MRATATLELPRRTAPSSKDARTPALRSEDESRMSPCAPRACARQRVKPYNRHLRLSAPTAPDSAPSRSSAHRTRRQMTMDAPLARSATT